MAAVDEALLARLRDLVTAANRGEGGLPGLQALVELAGSATGAAGATFIEYGAAGGRVVAASGELTFTIGSPIDASVPAIAGRGGQRPVEAAATVGDTVVGALQVYFPDPGGPAEAAGAGLRAVVELLAACAAHLYADNRGLPVYEQEPVAATAARGTAVIDAAGLVRSWNPAAEQLTGHDAETAIGRPPPFALPAPGEAIEHQAASGRWLRITAAPLAGTDSMAVSLRDHTASIVRERARDLFLAVASHELRTPVTVIRGYADTLVEHWDALDESVRREAVCVLGQRARELARLVDRMLIAATDPSGLTDGASRAPFDLADALHEAVEQLAPDMRAALRSAPLDPLPKALGDRGGLATVVTELVTNACKYSPGRVQVELTAGADAQTVWFRVADRGVGIRPEHVERAFERFWQLDRGDQRRHGGVGLGLYLVRRIVERQRGWVSLRPRDGGGTVAEVRLPRADTSPGEA
jgi:two-component system phosphate regulon sensor histidine kinase PhoR